MNLVCAVSLTCVACSAFPVQHSGTATGNGVREASHSVEPGSKTTPAPSEEWPSKRSSFLAVTGRAQLELLASDTPFMKQLAGNADHVLYDARLELVWFSSERRLWVIDLREKDLARLSPVLIASGLPPHVELQIDRRGTDFIEPMDTCDLAPALQLHWVDEPWIEGQGGQRLTDLDGHSWLARERLRAARSPTEERWLHPSNPHVALPPGRARCEDVDRCGAALPFAPVGWQLVLTDQSEGADCWHFGCLLRDSATGLFGTPPHPMRWGPADDMPSGPCGPYWFNADGSAFLVEDVICSVAGSCRSLDGSGIGWLVPGFVLGAAG